MSLMEDRQTHGVSRYRAGCKCEICLTARQARSIMEKDRKRRELIKGIPTKDLFICSLCGRYYLTERSARNHEAHCEW